MLETKEGLDRTLSLLYYSRAHFIHQLLPLLLASPLPGHAVSVFGPGRDTKLYADDLSLRDAQHYSFMHNGSHAAFMTTLFLERLAAQYPERLALAHYFPSLVLTEAFYLGAVPWWFKWAVRLLTLLLYLYVVPRKECGEQVVFLASPRFPARPFDTTAAVLGKRAGNVDVAVSSDGVLGGGAYRVNWNGETLPKTKEYKNFVEEELSEKIWNHTMKAFEVIEAGNVFTE
jgi:hypothetical protein